MPYLRQFPAPGNRDGTRRQEKMTAAARYPDSTKASLEQRLRARARDRWPQIASLHIRHRGNFSYVDATLADGTMLKLCRLRYVGSASQWQFAIYRASHDDYDESVFPTGLPVGTCQDALDTACGLYLNDPTAWIQPPTNLRARPLSVLGSRPGKRAGNRKPGYAAVPVRRCGKKASQELRITVWDRDRLTGAHAMAGAARPADPLPPRHRATAPPRRDGVSPGPRLLPLPPPRPHAGAGGPTPAATGRPGSAPPIPPP